MNIRNEAEEEKDEAAKPAGTEPDGACKSCGSANEENSKFCDQCGTSMAAAPTIGEGEDEDEDEAEAMDDGDEPPPSSKPAPAPPPAPGKKPAPAPPAKSQPPPPERNSASLAGLAGLHANASTAAIKSALIPVVGLHDFVLKLTDTRSAAEARGALKALVEDASAAGALRAQLRQEKAKSNYRERMDLLKSLASANLSGYTRGELFVDDVNEVTGKRTTRPAPMYAEMKLGTLRGLVAAKLKNTGTQARKTPFNADPGKAQAAIESANVERVVNTPEVQRFAARSTATPEQLARTQAALAAQGVFSGVN